MQIQMTIPDQKILDVVAASPEMQAQIGAILAGHGPYQSTPAMEKPTAKRSRKPAIEPPPTATEPKSSKRGPRKVHLAPGQPTASTKPRKAKAEKTSGKTGKRDPEAIEALCAAFAAHVKAHPGQPMEEINESLGASTKELALPVKKALAAGTVRTEGNKRATRYFPTSAAA